MPRSTRIVVPDYPLHIMIRGNNRKHIFNSDADYQFYLDKLKEAANKHACAIHAYVLMPNHVHLLLTPSTNGGPGKLMQMMGRYYVQYFNAIYKRSGTLFEGRYKSCLIDSDEYLLTCYRYLELNPVRANGLVEHPADYPWSSYAANALGNNLRRLITPHAAYLDLGADTMARISAYRELFKIRITDKQQLDIKEAISKGWVLGSDAFKAQLTEALNRPVEPLKRGGDRRSVSYRNGVTENEKNQSSLTPLKRL